MYSGLLTELLQGKGNWFANRSVLFGETVAVYCENHAVDEGNGFMGRMWNVDLSGHRDLNG
jgi:hypothetical protein